MPNRLESRATMSQNTAESDWEFQWMICNQSQDQRSTDRTCSLSLCLSDSTAQPQSGRLLCQLWQCSLPASTLWIGANRLWPRQRPARPDCYNGISVCLCVRMCCDLFTKCSVIFKSHPRATVHYRGTETQCTMTSTVYFHFHSSTPLITASCYQKASVLNLNMNHCRVAFFSARLLYWD